MMLEMKLELQNVEAEEEQAQLEAQLWEEEMEAEDEATGDRPDVTQAIDVSEEVTSSAPAVNHDPAQADMKDVSGIVTFPSNNNDQEIALTFAAPSQSTPAQNKNASTYVAGFYPVPAREQTSIEQLCQALTLTMNIPKPDIKSFSGDPAEYWAFVTGFETGFGSKVTDARTRLTYLVQYCRDKAKESIENCILMEPAGGYKKALEILREQFGQPYLIMHALLHKVNSKGRYDQTMAMPFGI
ncbi:uncharacterized protein LOC110991143 [Acanthaster planci]|uniref:Uncharacterized protein LOC110991143 n=1 Tax=Acanthaster planci TaxID=133434 RepID=A0A8B8A3T7_ACAPL|nr:uncharacterized protein LOC110991143 [Acanthaster planci]